MRSGGMETGLRDLLKDLQSKTQGLAGFVIFTKDGFPIVSTVEFGNMFRGEFEEVTDGEFFAAIGAGILSLAQRTLEQMGMLPLDRLLVESPKGNVIVEQVNEDMGIMAISYPGVPVGLVRMAVESARKKVRQFIRTEGELV